MRVNRINPPPAPGFRNRSILFRGAIKDYFFGAFFLPATVLRFPFLVRLFVRVR